jgi:hypothetical protein
VGTRFGPASRRRTVPNTSKCERKREPHPTNNRRGSRGRHPEGCREAGRSSPAQAGAPPTPPSPFPPGQISLGRDLHVCPIYIVGACCLLTGPGYASTSRTAGRSRCALSRPPQDAGGASRGQAQPAPKRGGGARRPMPTESAASGGDSSSNITVAVRVRPLSLKEKARQSWATVEVLDATHVLVRDRPLALYLHFSDFSDARRGRGTFLSHRLFLPLCLTPFVRVQVNDPDGKMGGIDYLRLDKTKTKHCAPHASGRPAALVPASALAPQLLIQPSPGFSLMSGERTNPLGSASCVLRSQTASTTLWARPRHKPRCTSRRTSRWWRRRCRDTTRAASPTAPVSDGPAHPHPHF